MLFIAKTGFNQRCTLAKRFVSPRLASVASEKLLQDTKNCDIVSVFAREAAIKLWSDGAQPELGSYLFLLPYLPGRYCATIPIQSVSLSYMPSG